MRVTTACVHVPTGTRYRDAVYARHGVDLHFSCVVPTCDQHEHQIQHVFLHAINYAQLQSFGAGLQQSWSIARLFDHLV